LVTDIVTHALIIGDNVAVSRAIQNRLELFGFDSFDVTCAENRALTAAAVRRPDLVVVGDAIVEGSPVSLAEKIASTGAVPLLIISSTQSFRLQRPLVEGEPCDGPYSLAELDGALAALTRTTNAQQPSAAQHHEPCEQRHHLIPATPSVQLDGVGPQAQQPQYCAAP
jgi:DNA-binding response OmpR family regulator